MKPTKIKRGTLAPLFDRIVDDKNEATPLQSLLDPDGLRASIVNELSTILNTRCTVRKVIYEEHINTIAFFGIPDFFGMSDFSYFDGSNPEDWPKARALIETAILAGEPRIQDVRVTVEGFSSSNQSLDILIYATLKETSLLKEVHFPLSIYLESSKSHEEKKRANAS